MTELAMEGTQSAASVDRSRRIIVVSDLHMTGGRDSRTGTWSPTEDFFVDDEFERFLAHFRGATPTTLVINGDLFDFLQVLEFPDEWRTNENSPGQDYVYHVSCSWNGREFRYLIPRADINPRYGLRCTEEAMRFVAGRVIEGHETFFRALVEFVSEPDNRVVILKGNHDVQLFWDGVQEEIWSRLETLVEIGSPSSVRERITFGPWFYYVPGIVWIEHGNQYEYTTSFVNFLHPTLPFGYDEIGAAAMRRARAAEGPAWVAPVESDADGPADDRHLELDFSSFLVRYLTNPAEPFDPLADNVRPLTRYWEGMWRAHPFFVVRTFGLALRFIFKAFGKAAGLRHRTGRSDRTMSDANRRHMDLEAARAGLDVGLLLDFDSCKATPTMSEGPWPVIAWFLKPTVAAFLWTLPLILVIANVTSWIRDPAPGGGIGQYLLRLATTLLQGALVIATAAALIGLQQYVHRVRAHLQAARARRARRNMAGAPDPSTPERPQLTRSAPMDMRTMALYIRQRLDVRFVTFGHTHYTDVFALGRDSRGDDAWYFNTGTWITVIEPREQLTRDARQLTFLEIEWSETGSSSARLQCWYPPRAEPRPVVVIDLREIDEGIANGIVTRAIDGIARVT